METNEIVKEYQAAEKEFLKVIEAVEELEEGDLKVLEETIYRGIFQIGRKLMEGRMNKGKESDPVPTSIEGKCGHHQKLVGYRPKKLLTLFGKVELKRAYYQCQVGKGQEEQEPTQKCSHGKAPAAEIWGIQGTRSTPGVQQYIGYFCSMLTFE